MAFFLRRFALHVDLTPPSWPKPQSLIAIEGVSGGGLVKILASAKGRIKSISIDDSLIVLSDKQMLEDLLAAAFNDAREKADHVSNEEMGKMTSGLPLPPGFKLPF